MKWVVSNCRGLASKLIGQGYELVSDGSDHHLVLVNLWPFNVNGAQVEKILNMASIMLNKKSVADDKSEIFTEGARIGTPGHDYKRFHTERFHSGVREIFPLKIKDIACKALTLKTQIKHDNLLLKSTIFFAPYAFVFGLSSSASLDGSATAMTILSNGDFYILLPLLSNMVNLAQPGDTPVSVKSSSKKINLEV
ncbi:hypothetical protein ACET3Z_018747 [Daucus carota]